MRLAVRTIDRALKSLYNVESPFRAEKFLLQKPLLPEKPGSLYVKKENEDLRVGIYFDPQVRSELSSFPEWERGHWTHKQLSAFLVATEEVSHFQYLLYQVEQGRAVSQFELELQAEIDKFLLTYFANAGDQGDLYHELLEKLFQHFRLHENLSEEQKTRYEDANRYAKKVIVHWQNILEGKPELETALKTLRRYYRLSPSEKVSYISGR